MAVYAAGKLEGLREAATQRLRPVDATKLTHGDSQEAAVEYGTRRLCEWQLYEVLRT